MIYVVASLPYNVCTFIERYILYVALTYSTRCYSVYGTKLKVLDSAVSHIRTKVRIVYLLLSLDRELCPNRTGQLYDEEVQLGYNVLS